MATVKKAQNGDSTSYKKTLSGLTSQGLDFEIGKLSKMVTPKSASSIIQQKIDILKREKSKRSEPNTTPSVKKNKTGGKVSKQLGSAKHTIGNMHFAKKRNEKKIMATIKKLLKSDTRMRGITPVPNGPLIKKKGEFKGSTLKNGGSTPAWTRKEGKNPTGGLNAKGRASYNAANPGSNLKAPQPEGGARKRSFCARMSGVKGPAKKPNGEPTRKTLALRKWKC